MKIDDDINNSIEEFEKKDNGNRISMNVFGIHKDIKNHCEAAAALELVNM